MSETRFTPGPWRIGGISMEDGSISIGHEERRIVIAYTTNAASFGDFISASLKGRRDFGAPYTAQTQWANAHLIAAAPELYEAVNALLGLLTLVRGRDDITTSVREALTHSHRIDEANAALTRARGEFPGGKMSNTISPGEREKPTIEQNSIVAPTVKENLTVQFLAEAAKYFEQLAADAVEDRERQAMTQNARNCMKASHAITEMTKALEFYRDGFQLHPKRSRAGLDLSEWKPKAALLDDCGNIALAALSRARGESLEGK